jgi:tight adherence protein C
MRRALLFLPILVASLVAWAPQVRAQAEEPAAPDTSALALPSPDVAAIAAAVAANPSAADLLVSAAVARDPTLAPDLVGKAIAALPSGTGPDIAGRIAAAAAAAAPASAPQIAGSAAAAAALAAGRAARPRGGRSPAEATQAALTASATAAATVAQAVINAIGQSPDTRVTARVASAVTQQAVVAAMKSTAIVASEAATAAGATPQEAAILAGQASRLAASTVTQAVISAATVAVQQAAATDAAAAAARIDASPETVAKTSAEAASLVANSVTQAAVEASVGQDKTAPIGLASAIADAAAQQTSSSVSATASAAAMSAGASPQEAQRIGDQAAVEAGKSVGNAAAAATAAAMPDLDLKVAGAAAGPALAGGIAGLAVTQRATARLTGSGGSGGSSANRVAAVTAEAEGLSVPPPPLTEPAASSSSPAPQRVVFAQDGDSLLDHPEKTVPAIFAMLAFVTVVGLALPWLQPDIFKSRLKVINERRGELSQQRKQRLEMQRPSLRRLTSSRDNFMRAVLEKLNIKNITEQPELKKKLVRAGYRSPQSIITFTFLRLALPLGVAGFSALLLFGSSNVHMAAAFKVLIITGGVLFAYLLPDIMVSNAIAKRQQEIQRKFPDAIDLMVICIESGISLEAAFARVSDEMGVDAPSLSEEIAITTAELAFLSDRRQALDNLSERTGSAPIKSLVTSLIQSEKYGTPLGQALRVVSQEGRESRMARAEEKAAALPAKLTVPMVTFFLPVLFMVLIGPTIIQVMKAFSN